MKLTEEEVDMIMAKRVKKADIVEKKKKKKRMSSNKRALFLAFAICVGLIMFTMVMIATGRDTGSLSILATAGVGILPIFYGIYNKAETKINLKHMEKNYDPNYDEKKGIY